MSGVVLNSRFLMRLLTSGKQGFEHVCVLQDTLNTACELTMLILSNVHIYYIQCDLFDCCIFNFEIMAAMLANTFLFNLQVSALAGFGVWWQIYGTLGRS